MASLDDLMDDDDWLEQEEEEEPIEKPGTSSKRPREEAPAAELPEPTLSKDVETEGRSRSNKRYPSSILTAWHWHHYHRVINSMRRIASTNLNPRCLCLLNS